MTKHFSVATFIIILLILGGCQSKVNGSDDLNIQANEIYLSIKDHWDNKEAISESDQEQITKFNEDYIVNYKDYPDDEELILEMEKLINSYQMYYAAIGQNNKESEERYSKNIDEALVALEKEFKN